MYIGLAPLQFGGGFAVNADDLRAIAPQEYQRLMFDQMKLAQQYTPTITDMLALANWQRPVYVPPGWADWFASGDGLV